MFLFKESLLFLNNTDHNLLADFEIRLAGTPELVASDIIL